MKKKVTKKQVKAVLREAEEATFDHYAKSGVSHPVANVHYSCDGRIAVFSEVNYEGQSPRGLQHFAQFAPNSEVVIVVHYQFHTGELTRRVNGYLCSSAILEVIDVSAGGITVRHRFGRCLSAEIKSCGTWKAMSAHKAERGFKGLVLNKVYSDHAQRGKLDSAARVVSLMSKHGEYRTVMDKFLTVKGEYGNC